MRVICPSCKAAIPGADIDLARGAAVCRPCGEVVPLPGVQSAAAIRAYKPASLRMEERVDGDAYVATLAPNRLAAFPLLFFCLFWDGFLAVWYAMAIGHGVWLFALFGLGHLAVGVYVTHQALVTLLNVRTLRLGDGRVSFRSSPVPLAGNLDAALDEVDAFAMVSRSNRGAVTHVLVANLVNGTQRKLGFTTSDPAQVAYVVDSFNDALRRLRPPLLLPQMPPYRE